MGAMGGHHYRMIMMTSWCLAVLFKHLADQLRVHSVSLCKMARNNAGGHSECVKVHDSVAGIDWLGATGKACFVMILYKR